MAGSGEIRKPCSLSSSVQPSGCRPLIPVAAWVNGTSVSNGRLCGRWSSGSGDLAGCPGAGSACLSSGCADVCAAVAGTIGTLSVSAAGTAMVAAGVGSVAAGAGRAQAASTGRASAKSKAAVRFDFIMGVDVLARMDDGTTLYHDRPIAEIVHSGTATLVLAGYALRLAAANRLAPTNNGSPTEPGERAAPALPTAYLPVQGLCARCHIVLNHPHHVGGALTSATIALTVD